MLTRELLNALMARYSLPSDYAVAKFLGREPRTVYRYRKTGGQMDDETAIKVAELLDMDPGEVLARIYAERTTCPAVRAVWRGVANRINNDKSAA